MSDFVRKNTLELRNSLSLNEHFLHVLIGPRQVGKSTAAAQVAAALSLPTIIVSADGPEPRTAQWLEEQWYKALELSNAERPALLVIDEMQKIRGWSETIKLLWDKIKDNKTVPLKVLLLGSSSLLIQEGLTESLAGRFLLHRFPHWSFSEMRELFQLSLSQWIYFGGYPGAAKLLNSESNWRSYILDSLVETTISRDILQLQRITKPTLLRSLFFSAVQHPAEIISYTKLMGLLPDAGNAGTVAHYTKLLASAFLVEALPAYPSHSSRVSRPKLITRNNALIAACSGVDFQALRNDSARWGRLVENAVGGHLLNTLHPTQYQLSYFRERIRGKDLEVDFVVQLGKELIGIEVTTTESHSRAGIEIFKRKFPKAKVLTIGPGGTPLEEFFDRPAEEFLRWFMEEKG